LAKDGTARASFYKIIMKRIKLLRPRFFTKPPTPPTDTLHKDFKKDFEEFEGNVNPETKEYGGPKGKEPTRYWLFYSRLVVA
jgi:Protein of unknown function (DUF1674)